ncbi:hypothetical protein EVAR_30547_1 [Eumeta japonica]|uniref:Uncharacterized protein n=1 Tax=Eumeta variegata TaxID=151549 RepID=A0A4C1VQL9_EUMVA|nr:hypothetical protein EVAR_30547_1 [Eumeta japonica]
MCEVSLKDRCRNDDVRERCGLKEDVVTRVERVSLSVEFGVTPPRKFSMEIDDIALNWLSETEKVDFGVELKGNNEINSYRTIRQWSKSNFLLEDNTVHRLTADAQRLRHP